jgi:nucleoside triphosphate diphosphatase
VNDSQPEASAHPASSPGVLDRALALIEFLRANCSWDAAQTHSSLRRYLLEEAHEVVDAIEAGDDDELRGELGDLLLNIAFQVVIAEERGAFDREAVVAQLEEKMRRRHPHLYGGERVAWESLKARERGLRPGDSEGILADLIAGSDALAHAHRIQARVSEVGFDWSEPRGAWQKVREEVEEVGEELDEASPERLEEEVGDLLFAVVNLARLCRVTPSLALSRANLKFARRFGRLERLASERGIILEEAGLAALDALWDDVKKEEL